MDVVAVAPQVTVTDECFGIACAVSECDVACGLIVRFDVVVRRRAERRSLVKNDLAGREMVGELMNDVCLEL